MDESSKKSNPLGTEPIPKLMLKFAIPSIIAMLVSSVYNIVDQLFIGQAIGTLGNAATNVVFPLNISCTALALLFGIGGASCYNLALGRGEKKRAPYFMGSALTMLTLSGIVLCLITELFTTPILIAFGTPDEVFPYAEEYANGKNITFVAQDIPAEEIRLNTNEKEVFVVGSSAGGHSGCSDHFNEFIE